jgi:hypothetical protein
MEWLVAIVLAESMNGMRKYVVYCPFCAGATEEEVSDFHPLSVQELVTLLQEAVTIWAKKEDNPYAVGEISYIQARLRQAISGMVCPYPCFGPLAERLHEVNRAFCAWIDNPDTLFFKETPLHEESDIVVTMARLLQ